MVSLPNTWPFRRRARDVPAPRDVVQRARPLRNPAVAWERLESGGAVLTIPLVQRNQRNRLLARIIPAPDQRQLQLDEVGADVWELCDGETPIAAIQRSIGHKYGLNAMEAEKSLQVYLQQLAKRRLLVAVAGEEPPEDARAEGTSGAGGRRRTRRRRGRSRSVE